MRWLKAALLFGICAVVAFLLYGVTGSIAVPTAVALSGVIFACMALTLDGDSAPHPAPRSRVPDPAGPGAEASDRQPATAPTGSAARWPTDAGRPDPDTEAWRTAGRVA